MSILVFTLLSKAICFDMKDARMDLIIWLSVHVIIDQKHWKLRLKNI